MTLKITELNGIYYVEGKMNTTTAVSLKTHLNNVLNTEETLLINIDGATEIDDNGYKVLDDLYNKAIVQQYDFQIVTDNYDTLFENIA